MKTVLSVLCWVGIAVMISGCDDGDDGGSAGGYGEFPEVSFQIDDQGTEDTSDDVVMCYNADKNVITTHQICTWNCANYNNKGAVRKVTLWFDEALICYPTGETEVDEVTMEEKAIEECSMQLALVKEDFDPCVL